MARSAPTSVLRVAALWLGGGALLCASGAATGFAVRAVRAPAPPEVVAAAAAAAAAPATRAMLVDVDAPAPPKLPKPAACPLTPDDPPWLAVTPPVAPEPPQTPSSLARRVELWRRVWGELNDHQHLLVDERRPWVVHAEVDCRDLFEGGDADAAKDACGARIADARRAAQKQLKRGASARELSKRFDGDHRLARTAYQHIMGLQGRRDALARAQARAAPTLGHTEGLFEMQEVPRIYARAAIVESLWRPEALSRSGAAGAYQFMPKTGAQFLLVDEGVVDERLDPLRAAWAAAHYMSKMSKELKDWPLVLTAYNTGPARLKNVMKVRHTRDLGKIADAGDVGEFGFDGQNYYAQIAAIGQLTAAARFEPEPVVGRALRVDEALSFTDLAACVEADVVALARDNPALAQAVVDGRERIPAGYVARVPAMVEPALAVR